MDNLENMISCACQKYFTLNTASSVRNGIIDLMDSNNVYDQTRYIAIFESRLKHACLLLHTMFITRDISVSHKFDNSSIKIYIDKHIENSSLYDTGIKTIRTFKGDHGVNEDVARKMGMLFGGFASEITFSLILNFNEFVNDAVFNSIRKYYIDPTVFKDFYIPLISEYTWKMFTALRKQ